MTTTQPTQPPNQLHIYLRKVKLSQKWMLFGAAIFLVCVPVFFQAPLVRTWPVLSLLMTIGWLALSLFLMRSRTTWVWGDLLIGFTLSWLTGSIYWGWLRGEPLLHLPIEALGIPFAVWCLHQGWGKIGNWFYLGSLFGTAVTDGYFYITGLIPSWRQLMTVDPSFAVSILQDALERVITPWGISWAIVLVLLLLGVGLFPLKSKQLHKWVFSGAVLSTILVDSLFLVAACAA